MELEAVRAFVAVARAGGFTAAAKSTGATQPSLSRRVQQLEAEVGTRLVVRAARGISLTRAGDRFLVHAERALRSLEAGVTEVDELSEKPHGTVAIGAMPTVGSYVLPEVISLFHERHPEVVVKMREGFPEELEELLARGELDLAIYNLPVRRADFAVRRLWQEDYLLVVPADHRLASAKKVDLAEIVRDPLVVIRGAIATRALEAACEEQGVPPKIVIETEGVESVRRMVVRGLGVALLPRLIVDEEFELGLRAIEVGKGAVRRQVALVHRGEGYLTAAARALRTLLVEARRRRP
ncbi:MAG: LysR family transcriptional regulator [Polyangiales bacterium]